MSMHVSKYLFWFGEEKEEASKNDRSVGIPAPDLASPVSLPYFFLLPEGKGKKTRDLLLERVDP